MDKPSYFEEIRLKLSRSRYFAVTLLIVTFLLFLPYAQNNGIAFDFTYLLLSLSLVAAGFSVFRTKTGGKLIVAFTFLTLTFIIFYLIKGTLILEEVVRTLTAITFGFVAVIIFAEIVSIKAKEYVTRDFLWAGIATYLLIGLTCGSIFHLIQLVTPGSFSSAAIPSAMEYPNFIYYGYYVLTTIDGVMTPNTLQAQSLVMIEPIIGTLYVAILISRLVTLRKSESSN